MNDAEIKKLQDYLMDWCCSWSIGAVYDLSIYDEYTVKLWSKIVKLVKFYEKVYCDNNITIEQLLNVKYVGPIYRVFNRRDIKGGVIYPMMQYQSWSKDISGFKGLAYKINSITIIESYADDSDYALDLSGVLELLGIRLPRYEKELEVVAPVIAERIISVYSANMDYDGNITNIKDIDNNYWFRTKWF